MKSLKYQSEISSNLLLGDYFKTSLIPRYLFTTLSAKKIIYTRPANLILPLDLSLLPTRNVSRRSPNIVFHQFLFPPYNRRSPLSLSLSLCVCVCVFSSISGEERVAVRVWVRSDPGYVWRSFYLPSLSMPLQSASEGGAIWSWDRYKLRSCRDH